MSDKDSSVDDYIQSIHEKIFNRIVQVLSFLIIAIVIVALVRKSEIGNQIANQYQIFSYALLIIVVLTKNIIAYRLRLALFLGGMFIASFTGFISYGLHGVGAILITITLIFSSIFLSRKAFYSLATMSFLVVLVIAYFIASKVIVLTFDPEAYGMAISSWAMLIVSSVVMSWLVISIISAMFNDLKLLSAKLQEQVEVLTQHDHLLESVLNGIVEPIFVKDDQHRLIMANDAFCKYAGKTREEILGMPNYQFVTREEELNIWKHDDLALTSDQPDVNEVKVSLAGKPRILSTIKSAFMNPVTGKMSIVGISRDVTEIKRVEQQLQQAQKMDAVGRLAGGIAHDFNNMLGVILGYTERMLRKADETHPFYSDLEKIKEAGERSASLTRQLLAFARKQVIMPQVLGLNESVTDMIGMLKRMIGEDIELIWKPGESAWPIRVDQGQVDQILANLCVNARDAINDVGEVRITTENCVLDETYSEGNPGSLSGDYVLLSVADSGSGIGPEIFPHLFEPFFTTKSTGTGLGLATVYGIVKQNDGYISASSEPGQGSLFKIYFPRYVGDLDKSNEHELIALTAQEQELILLVEDESAILEITASMLDSLGYRVLSASTPGKAIEYATDYGTQIDLLITDVVMPEMNGSDLANTLSVTNPGLGVLFMSGYTADVIGQRGVLDENLHFIPKPFSLEELSIRVRKVLNTSE